MARGALISVDLHAGAATARPWSLRAPEACLRGPDHHAFDVTAGSEGLDAGALGSLLDAARRLTAGADAPLLLLSGPPALQLALLSALQSANLCSRLRPVPCVAAWHRPLLPPAQPFVHGLIVDAPPTAAESACWERAFHRGVRERVYLIAADRTSAGAAPARGRAAGSGAEIAMAAPEADAWMALGIQAFAIWSAGRYGRCARCGAASLDRFHPHTARFEARPACLHCGSPDLVRARPRDAARLSVAVPDGVPCSPDPDVLARWLGVAGRVRVRPLPAPDEPGGLVRLFARAGVALVLNDPLYPDVRLAAARASGARLVTNNAAAGGERAVTGLAACHDWDSYGQVTAWPTLPALVRALDAAARRDAPRGDAAVGDPGARPGRREAWSDAIRRLDAAPRRRMRLRGPRGAS